MQRLKFVNFLISQHITFLWVWNCDIIASSWQHPTASPISSKQILSWFWVGRLSINKSVFPCTMDSMDTFTEWATALKVRASVLHWNNMMKYMVLNIHHYFRIFKDNACQVWGQDGGRKTGIAAPDLTPTYLISFEGFGLRCWLVSTPHALWHSMEVVFHISISMLHGMMHVEIMENYCMPTQATLLFYILLSKIQIVHVITKWNKQTKVLQFKFAIVSKNKVPQTQVKTSIKKKFQ